MINEYVVNLYDNMTKYCVPGPKLPRVLPEHLLFLFFYYDD